MSVQENLNSNPKRKTTFTAFIILLIVVLLGVSLYLFGKQGLLKVLVGLVVFLLIAGVVGIIFIIVVKALFPPKKDMVNVVFNRILKGAELRKPDLKTNVYLSGDRRDFERKYLGELTGMIRTALNPPLRPASESEIKSNDKRIIKVRDEFMIPEGVGDEFYFITIKMGGFFGSKKIIGVKREDISNPNMQEVYLKDTTLTAPFGNIYYLGKYDNQTHIIEMRLTDYVKRYTLEDMLRELKVIVDDAIQSSPSHQKGQENKGMAERVASIGED